MRLITKLILSLAALSLSVLISTLAMVYFSEKRHLKSMAQQEQVTALSKLARVCEDSMIDQNDFPRLAYLRTFMGSTPAVAYAALIDANHRLIMHSDFLRDDFARARKITDDPQWLQAALAPGVLRQSGADGRLLLLSAPVSVAGQRKATLLIAYDKAAQDAALARIQADSLRRYAQVAVAGLIVSLIMAIVMAQALSRRLLRLREGARAIGEGKLETRIQNPTQDELGDLTQEFNSMAKKLADLHRLRESFLAQITHDLRNPLNAMIGYANLLRHKALGPLDPKQAEAVTTVEKEGHFLAELVDNILISSQLEDGRMELAKSNVDFHQVAEEVVERMRLKAEEFNVRLSHSVPGGAVVFADPQGLRRVLTNLVSNALKFTPSGGAVSIERVADSPKEEHFIVRDTGVGVPAEKTEVLFQKFGQIAETLNVVRPSKGLGLGLVVVKNIVQAHGGRVWVENVVPQGAIFHVTLPAT